MEKDSLMYEGKGKKVYGVKNQPDQVIISFKDDLTAHQGKKKSSFAGKGEICHRVFSLVFRYLTQEGLSTHWIKDLNSLESLCLKTQIFPLEVVVRNRLAGSTAKRLGIPEGTKISEPLLEYYYKKDELDDPFISEDQIIKLSLIKDVSFLSEIKKQAFLINEKLKSFFYSANLELVDFKVEFGLDSKKNLVLSDDISPDSCRLWDINSEERLDKDRFRRGWGRVEESYREIEKRVSKAWLSKVEGVSLS